MLYRALLEGPNFIIYGEKDSENITKFISGLVKDESEGDLDYVGIVDSETFTQLDYLNTSGKQVQILIACQFGNARLIDNIGVVIP